jgi:hypothetical protein
MTKASRQSLRKDPINIAYLRVVFTIIHTHFPDEPTNLYIQSLFFKGIDFLNEGLHYFMFPFTRYETSPFRKGEEVGVPL